MKRSYHFKSPAQRGWTLTVAALMVFLLAGVLWSAAASGGGNQQEMVPLAGETPTNAAPKIIDEGPQEPIPEASQESVAEQPADAPAGDPAPEALVAEKPAPAPPVGPPQQPAPSAPPMARPSAPPVAIGEPAPVSAGILTKVLSIESVQGEARIPGEIAAPAIRVTLQFTNHTQSSVDMTRTVVIAEYGPDSVPAEELGGGASDFPTEIAPGQSASAVFIFAVPVEQRNGVRFLVDHKLDLPVVVIEGAAPRG
ncbi:hypothetical protein [Arthrobacter rhizosphaerae]|uniref:hypothetical protein n=1 Tax=Arthrobacter rhizosphaerae TaxID=2855490 RepID=UPI001FF59BD3|nr:hypothetical protein [Arthrobacter rhizosphaerae]